MTKVTPQDRNVFRWEKFILGHRLLVSEGNFSFN